MRPEFASRYSTDGFGATGEMLIDPPFETIKCKIVCGGTGDSRVRLDDPKTGPWDRPGEQMRRCID